MLSIVLLGREFFFWGGCSGGNGFVFVFWVNGICDDCGGGGGGGVGYGCVLDVFGGVDGVWDCF